MKRDTWFERYFALINGLIEIKRRQVKVKANIEAGNKILEHLNQIVL